MNNRELLESVIAMTGCSILEGVGNAKRTKSLHSSGRVTRWHTHGRAMQQSTAEHAWGVAAIILAIRPDASAELLRAAILHDAHEVDFADVPYPVKRRYAEIAEVEDCIQQDFLDRHNQPQFNLTPDECRLLKAADRLESLLFIVNNIGGLSNHERTRMAVLIRDSIVSIMKGGA